MAGALMLSIALLSSSKVTANVDNASAIQSTIKQWKSAIEHEDLQRLRYVFVVTGKPASKLFYKATSLIISEQHLRSVASKKYGKDANILDSLSFMTPVAQQLGILLDNLPKFDLTVKGNHAVLKPAHLIPNLHIHGDMYFEKVKSQWKIDANKMLQVSASKAHVKHRLQLLQKKIIIINNFAILIKDGKVKSAESAKALLVARFKQLYQQDAESDMKSSATQPSSQTQPSK